MCTGSEGWRLGCWPPRARASGGCGCGAGRAALLLEGTGRFRVAAEFCVPDSPGKWPRTACPGHFSTHSSLGNLCVQIVKLLCGNFLLFCFIILRSTGVVG